MTDIATERPPETAARGADSRWGPLTGIAFVVFFLASVVVSTVPANDASNKAWVAAYTGHGHAAQHLATGVLLVFAALSLMSFLTLLWRRIAAARQPVAVSPLPLVAAGVSAACIAVGGVVMGSISGSILFSTLRVPDADLLRFGNDLGFAMVGVGGMLAAALSVACLSVQARSAGVFGRKLTLLGLLVSVVLLGAVEFLPIAALLIWLVIASITLMRRRFVAGHSSGTL